MCVWALGLSPLGTRDGRWEAWRKASIPVGNSNRSFLAPHFIDNINTHSSEPSNHCLCPCTCHALFFLFSTSSHFNIYNYKMQMRIWKESTTKWMQILKGGVLGSVHHNELWFLPLVTMLPLSPIRWQIGESTPGFRPVVMPAAR